MSRTSRFHYLIVTLAVALAFLVRLWHGPEMSAAAPFLTFWPVVLLGAVYGGFWIGVYASLLLTIVMVFFFFTRFTMDLSNPQDAFILLVFIIISTLASFVMDCLRLTQRMVDQGAKTLQIVLGKIGDAVIVTDMNGVVISWNAGASQIFGDAAVERVGKPLINRYKTFTNLVILDLIERLRSEAEVISEWEDVRNDGTPIWVQAHAQRLPSVDGRPDNLLLVCRDLTGEKQSERALWISDKLFGSAFRQSAIGMALASPQGRLSKVNPPLCQILGYSEEELVGTAFMTLTHPDDVASDTARRSQILQGVATSPHWEKRYIHKDGHIVWVQMTGVLIRDEREQPLYFTTQMQDITERKRVESELQDTFTRLFLAMDAGRTFAFDWDLSSDKVRRSANSGEILGLEGDPTNDTGAEFFARVHPEDNKLFESFIANLTPLSRTYTRTYRTLRADKAVVWLQESAVAEFDESGRLSRLFGMVADCTERMNAQEALRESEERFRRFIDSGPLVAFIKDEDGKYVYVNEKFSFLSKIDAASMVGRYDSDVFPPNVVQALRANDHRALTENSLTQITEFVSYDNGIHESIVYKFPLTDNSGRKLLGGIALDVTEQRRAEEKLQFQSRLLDAVGQAVIAINTDGSISYANQAVRQYGWEPDELIGRDVGKTLIPANQQAAAMEIVSALREGRAWQGEIRSQRKDGSEFTAFTTQVPFHDDQDDLVGTIGVVTDITERRQSEIALRESERRFRVLADLVPNFVWTAVPGSGCDYVNLRFQEVTGLSFNECLGTGGNLAIHPDDRSVIEDIWKQCEATGQEFASEHRILTKEGVYRWYLGRAVPYRTESGEILTWFGTGTDIDDQKQIQEELRAAKEVAEEASRAKSQFLAVLSHELRTPLTPVMAVVTAQLDRDDLSDEIRSTLEMVRRNIQLESRLIDDLLDLMRTGQGKLQLQLSVVDLHELIPHIVELCKSDIESLELKMELDLQASAYRVEGDPARLQQVVWNLLQNASKCTPCGGLVSIRTRNDAEQPSHIILEVADSGQGIEPDLLDRIFDPFEQGKTRMRRRFGGLGLGLSISRSIAEAHGGSLEGSSPGHGQGAVFTLTLVSCNAPVTIPPSLGEPAAQGPVSVLIVEDNEDTLRSLASLLRSCGHTVTTADCVSYAITLTNEHFDILLSDIELPDGTGLDLIREFHGRVPGIAMSGFGAAEDIQSSLDAGFSIHLTKPITFRQLTDAIHKVVKT